MEPPVSSIDLFSNGRPEFLPLTTRSLGHLMCREAEQTRVSRVHGVHGPLASSCSDGTTAMGRS